MQADYFCAACRTPFVTPFPLDEAGLCGLCRRGMVGFDAAYSFGSYEGALQKLILLFKYGGIHTLAQPLGRLLADAFPRSERADLIVPVPMHWWRRWRRGFNQAELLASELARRTGLPLRNAVRRKRWTPPQAGLSNSLRRKNVSNSFETAKPAAVRGLHVLLVDDVFTTGATASACASALKRAGARRVSVLTLARADRRLEPLVLRPLKTKTTATGGC
jgi:ComF family protein